MESLEKSLSWEEDSAAGKQLWERGWTEWRHVLVAVWQ